MTSKKWSDNPESENLPLIHKWICKKQIFQDRIQKFSLAKLMIGISVSYRAIESGF